MKLFNKEKHKWSKWQHVMFYETAGEHYCLELFVRYCGLTGLAEYKSVTVEKRLSHSITAKMEQWYRKSQTPTIVWEVGANE